MNGKIIWISFLLGTVDRRSMNVVVQLAIFDDIFLMYFSNYEVIFTLFWRLDILEGFGSILDYILIEVVILNFLISSGIIWIERSYHKCLLIFSFDINWLQVRIICFISACNFRDKAILVRKALFELFEKIISDLRGLTSLLRKCKTTIYKIKYIWKYPTFVFGDFPSLNSIVSFSQQFKFPLLCSFLKVKENLDLMLCQVQAIVHQDKSRRHKE